MSNTTRIDSVLVSYLSLIGWYAVNHEQAVKRFLLSADMGEIDLGLSTASSSGLEWSKRFEAYAMSVFEKVFDSKKTSPFPGGPRYFFCDERALIVLLEVISSIRADVEGHSNRARGFAFYEGMASIALNYAAEMLSAYDHSPAGNRFVEREGRSAYCLERLHEILTSEATMAAMADELIAEARGAGSSATFFDAGTSEAISYFCEGPWQDLGNETKANLLNAIRQQFDWLTPNPGIKTRFFEGRPSTLSR